MTHLSSLTIDALAGGHLTGDEAARAREHVAACTRCKADLDAAEAACATFTREVFPRTVESLRPNRPWWRAYFAAWLVPVLAAAGVLLWFGVRPKPREEADLRIKGAASFQIFAKRGDEVFAVRDGARLAPGDQIRFIAGAERERYLLVASVDGDGKATVYYPFGASQSGSIGKAPSELPGSIVLDAARGPERVFALFSERPLEVAAVTRELTTLGARGGDAIRATSSLAVDARVQISVVFEKVTP